MQSENKKTPLLDTITNPHQLTRLSHKELDQLAEEIRQRVIDVVSRQGGHLASNLGIAELTIAMHYVFDFAKDRLLWDVGHQCYAHKLLTGRNEQFDHLRQAGGLSGFPAPSESEYDLFSTGHAGTAISTAAGLAWADQYNKSDTKIVSMVGDASIVNGLSLEGINNLSLLKRQFLIVLNDNSMAIDRTHGALAHALDRLRMTSTYSDLKHSTESLLSHLPLGHGIADAIKSLGKGLKTTIHGAQVFEALGLGYFGPVDGHNIPELIRILKHLSTINHPVVLHVHTEKGRGCQYAVENPCRFHSPSAYTVKDGQAVFPEGKHKTWTKVFSEALVQEGAADDKVVAITAAMPDGTGLVDFRKKFPKRYIDVGISEEHAVTMAAGISKAELKPVVAIYSTFMQRAVDQIFHDLSLQKLPAVLCMDRAGLVGSDGAVHHGAMDIAMLRSIPNTILLAPAEEREMQQALNFALNQDKITAIRYPRDEIPQDMSETPQPFELGKARVMRDGNDATFLCYGTTVEQAMQAAVLLEKNHDVYVSVVNARFAKPLDEDLIGGLIKSGKPVVVCEEHAVSGGFGSAVLELAGRKSLNASSLKLVGLPDHYISAASRTEQLMQVGLDTESLVETMLGHIKTVRF